MMEAAPFAPRLVSTPDLLFEFLIVSLDTPAQLGKVDELAEANIGWQRRQPIFGRLGFALGPFDQQPLLRYQFRGCLTVSDPNAHARKARRQPIGRTFPPTDRAPSPLGQTKRHLLDGPQAGVVATPRLVQFALAPWSGTGWPHQGLRLNAGHIGHPQRRHAGAQPRVTAIGAVHQCDPARQAGLARPSYLLERDLRFGLEADV